MLNIYHTKKI